MTSGTWQRRRRRRLSFATVNANLRGPPVMATTQTSTGTTHLSTTGRKLARFVGHYVEMVAAMIVGMVALGPIWPSDWVARPDVHAIVMATDMTIAMALWMRIRAHSWPRIVEMSAVMYVPFLVLLVPYWLGALSGMGLMIAGHVIMFPLMLVAMLWRRSEYWH
jgi:flagellar biosynthetic protein FliP